MKNVLYEYARNSLKKNKTRTLVTIIGIILSTALIVALLTMAYSFYCFMQEGYEDKTGQWHFSLSGLTAAELAPLQEDERFDQWILAEQKNSPADNGSEPDFVLLYGDKDFYSRLPIEIVKGRIPELENEIILPEYVLDKNYGAGDTLEIFGVTYTVTGTYRTNLFSAHNFGDSVGLSFKDANALKGAGTYYAWFQLADVSNSAFHDVYSKFHTTYGNERLDVNTLLLSMYGVRISDSDSLIITGAIALLLLIILIGCVMMIYNAFGISVNERTRQFGLLSSIGTTEKQIKKIIFYEAGILSLFGITGGILAGMLAVFPAIRFAGPAIAQEMEISIPFRTYLSFPAILLAALLAAATIFISAWIPSRRASRITAMEAIRQSQDFKYSGGKKHSFRWPERLFGFECTLALQYYSRNRRKYRITTISLFISMVLFISVSAFCSYLMDTMEAEYKTQNYEVMVTPPGTLTPREEQNIFRQLSAMEQVTDVTWVKGYMINFSIEENQEALDSEFLKIMGQSSFERNGMLFLSVVDDESFSQYCREHDLDESLYRNAENPLFIAKNDIRSYDTEREKTVSHPVLKEGASQLAFPLPGVEVNKSASYTIGYFADSLAPGCNSNDSLALMIPRSLAEDLQVNSADSFLHYFLVTPDHAQVTADAQAMLSSVYPEVNAFDQRKRQESNQNLMLLLRVFSIAFIMMIFCISVANVSNTVSTNIRLRRREFAMLKTVGLTQKGLQKMLGFECFIYGGKSVLYGTIASLLIAFAMYRNFTQDLDFDFYIPLPAFLLSTGMILVVMFINVAASMKRIRQDNLIDAIKTDN